MFKLGSAAVAAFLILAAPTVARAADDNSVVAPAVAPTTPSVGAPSCAVDKHPNVSDADAAAVEDVVCGLIRSDNMPGRHRIRVTKLGSKIVLTLATTFEGVVIEKQITLSDIGEITVGAPRLLQASSEGKPVADTVDVNNVVGDEARIPKKKHSHVHGWLGILGGSAWGQGSGGGISTGLSAGSDRWSFVGDLRLAGGAFNKPAALAALICTLGTVEIDTKSDFSYVSLAAGVRHHLLSTDVSPFVGAGLALDYISLQDASSRAGTSASYSSGRSNDYGSKTGFAGYGEVGLDILRTHSVGGAFILRADAPAFSVDTVEPIGDGKQRKHTSAYAPVVSAGIALRF